MSEHAANHRAAADRHEGAAERFEDMADRAGDRGDVRRQRLFRRIADLERGLSAAEREWATITEEDPPSNRLG